MGITVCFTTCKKHLSWRSASLRAGPSTRCFAAHLEGRLYGVRYKFPLSVTQHLRAAWRISATLLDVLVYFIPPFQGWFIPDPKLACPLSMTVLDLLSSPCGTARSLP